MPKSYHCSIYVITIGKFSNRPAQNHSIFLSEPLKDFSKVYNINAYFLHLFHTTWQVFLGLLHLASIISGNVYSYWNDVSFFLLLFLKKSDKYSLRTIYLRHNFNRFDNLKRRKVSKQSLDYILSHFFK